MAETTSKRILVVDDANLVRRFYRDALERAGLRGRRSPERRRGAGEAFGESFDLVIVDINMPQMDGFTFLKTLRRQTAPISSVPALVISTEAGPQDMAAARAAGANFYLVKPVRQDTLVEHVTIMCGLPA